MTDTFEDLECPRELAFRLDGRSGPSQNRREEIKRLGAPHAFRREPVAQRRIGVVKRKLKEIRSCEEGDSNPAEPSNCLSRMLKKSLSVPIRNGCPSKGSNKIDRLTTRADYEKGSQIVFQHPARASSRK